MENNKLKELLESKFKNITTAEKNLGASKLKELAKTIKETKLQNATKEVNPELAKQLEEFKEKVKARLAENTKK